MRSSAAVTTALLAVLGCSEDTGGRASAARLSSISQRIGGPKALGDVGDYVLENDKIRVIIHGPGANRVNGIFPGSIIDADLLRPARREGGRDQLGEVFPAFMFEAMNPTEFRVTKDGSDGGPAIVTMEGEGGDLLQTVALLNAAVLFPTNLHFQVDYILEPGKNYVEMVTRVRAVDSPHRFPFIDPPDLAGLGIDIPGLDQLSLSTPFGHYVILGAEQQAFTTGALGFDIAQGITELYEDSEGLPAFPGAVSEFVATKGDGVSYGIAVPEVASNYIATYRDSYQPAQVTTNHGMLIPFEFSGLIALYHTSPPSTLAAGEEFSYSTYFIVGDGDVSSVADTVYELHGTPTGTFSAWVYDSATHGPAEGASVVVKDTRGLFVNQFTADSRGQFTGQLPAGDYSYQVVSDARHTTDPVPFSIAIQETTAVRVPLESPGRIAVQVTDDSGRRIPSKAILVGRFDSMNIGRDPRDFLHDEGVGERRRVTAFENGRNEFIEARHYSKDGRFLFEARPGDYDLVIARGFEYEIHSEPITVTSGGFIERSVSIERSLNTNGYVAADLHLHANRSTDSGMPLDERVISIAGEGIEYAAATDHNAVTDYQPTIAQVGLTEWLVSSVGVEVTSFEMGHFNGYPLKYDSTSVRGGDIEWQHHTPQAIFDQIRSRAKYDDSIVQINHPRWSLLGYFNAYNYNQETGNAEPLDGLRGVFWPSGPEFSGQNFSKQFDAVEIINGQRQDLVHTYRVPADLPPPPLPDPADIPPVGTVLRLSGTSAPLYQGVLEDWFSLLNNGQRIIAVGSSDSHSASAEAGMARTLVYIGEGKDVPGGFTEEQVIAGMRGQRTVVSTGPMAEIRANGTPMGGTVVDTDGTVTIEIQAQVTSWMNLTRAIVYGNGDIVAEFDIPPGESKQFQATRDVAISRDTWFVLEVIGDSNLFPVVAPLEVATTNPEVIIDALSVGMDLSALSPFKNLMPQEAQYSFPQAITSPVWVDANGNGQFEPIGAGVVLPDPPMTAAPAPIDVRDIFDRVIER